MQTFFTLLKGFIGTGILYMPQEFYFAGWGFSAIAMFLSYVMALYCAFLLLETRQICGGRSFTEIGEIAYGRTGRILAEVFLVIS